MIITITIACLIVLYKIIGLMKVLDKNLISKKMDKEFAHARLLQKLTNEQIMSKKLLLQTDKDFAESEAKLQTDEDISYANALLQRNDELAQHWSCESYVHSSITDRNLNKILHELFFNKKIEELLNANESNYFENGIAFDTKYRLSDFIICHILGYETFKVINYPVNPVILDTVLVKSS